MLGSMGEFDLIESYFKRPARHATLGVGDDCALLAIAPGQQLAISSDMLVEGRHFLSTVQPRFLGHKALAVNLSDLAACGAKPKALMLALSLPQIDPHWLSEFSQGLWALADEHDIDLIGGDTTRGPLNICITVLGEVPASQALLRSGAQVGDDIYVSGNLGDARLALEVFRGNMTLRLFLKAPDCAWNSPHRAWHWAWLCAALRMQQPTSAMDCWAIWAMFCKPAAWVLTLKRSKSFAHWHACLHPQALMSLRWPVSWH
jgi:thiamine monophosphate kinase